MTKRLYDVAKQEAKALNLSDAVTLVETNSYSASVQEGKFVSSVTTKNENKIAPAFVSKTQELKNAIKSRGEKDCSGVADLQNATFKSTLIVGDRLPVFTKLFKVGATATEEQQETTLEHKKGEVLLIDIWATWCGPCQKPMQHNQDMLTKNAHWKDKVRIVAVSVDEERQQLINRIEKKKWDLIQHLTLNGWKHDHEIISYFNVNGIPCVVLIDRSGIIQYIGHPSSGKLQQRIEQFIGQDIAEPKVEPTESHQIKNQVQQVQQKETGQEKFHSLVIALKQSNFQNIPEAKLTYTVVRTFSNGKQTITVSKPKLSYTCDKAEASHYTVLTEFINKHVQESQYTIDAYIKDPVEQRNYHYNNLKKILEDSGIQNKPHLQTLYSANFVKSTKFQSSSSFVLPELAYGSEISFKQVTQISSKTEQYLEQVEGSGKNVEFIGKITRPCHKLVGAKFFGFSNGFFNINNAKQPSVINPIANRIQIIALCNHTVDSASKFVPVLKNHLEEVELDLCVLSDQAVTDLTATFADFKNVRFHRMPEFQGSEFVALNARSLAHTVIVDKWGVIRTVTNLDNTEAVEKAIGEASAQFHEAASNFDNQTLKRIDELETNEVIAKTHENLKNLNYQALFTLSYAVNKEHNAEGSTNSARKAQIKLRESDKHLIQEALKLIKALEFTVREQYIETRTIPTATHCSSCQKEISFPYYFYHWSKIHRCRECGEKENKDTDNLNRYDVKESAILVFGDLEYDLKRVGSNIQPDTNDKCGGHGFSCNGCSGGSGGQARYICMGCRREPNPHGDYVDFCSKCVRNFISGNEEGKPALEHTINRDKHSMTHPLLRVNWNVKGYYEF